MLTQEGENGIEFLSGVQNSACLEVSHVMQWSGLCCVSLKSGDLLCLEDASGPLQGTQQSSR